MQLTIVGNNESQKSLVHVKSLTVLFYNPRTEAHPADHISHLDDAPLLLVDILNILYNSYQIETYKKLKQKN